MPLRIAVRVTLKVHTSLMLYTHILLRMTGAVYCGIYLFYLTFFVDHFHWPKLEDGFSIGAAYRDSKAALRQHTLST